jgi:cell division protein FtsB
VKWVNPVKSAYLTGVDKAFIGPFSSIFAMKDSRVLALGWHNYINGSTWNLSPTVPAQIAQIQAITDAGFASSGAYLTYGASGFGNWGSAHPQGTGNTIETHVPQQLSKNVSNIGVWTDPEAIITDGFTTQVDGLTQEITSLNQQLAVASSNLQACTGNETNQQTQVADLTAKLIASGAQVTTLANNNSALQAQLTDVQKQVTDLSAANQALTTETSSLKTQLATSTTRANDLAAANQALQQQIAQLQAQLASQAASNSGLQTQVSDLTTKLAAAQDAIVQLNLKLTAASAPTSCPVTSGHENEGKDKDGKEKEQTSNGYLHWDTEHAQLSAQANRPAPRK